jgi:hypothetical protein
MTVFLREGARGDDKRYNNAKALFRHRWFHARRYALKIAGTRTGNKGKTTGNPVVLML